MLFSKIGFWIIRPWHEETVPVEENKLELVPVVVFKDIAVDIVKTLDIGKGESCHVQGDADLSREVAKNSSLVHAILELKPCVFGMRLRANGGILGNGCPDSSGQLAFTVEVRFRRLVSVVFAVADGVSCS